MHSFTGILELDDSDDCVEPTQERQRICNDGVPSGCCLCRVREVGISCRHCLDVGRRPVYHTTFAARFVKFVSARFPVLQTITRTELYVVSC